MLLHALPIKQEPDCSRRFSLSLAKGIHQLLELGGALDLEEDFVIAIGDFDVEVFGAGLLRWRSAVVRGSKGAIGAVVVRHGGVDVGRGSRRIELERMV